MATHRSALGRTIDMGQIAAKNEHVRAVGNMNVNARGDTIDSHGKIVVPVTKKVGAAYQRTVSNRAANLIRQKNGTGPVEPTADIEEGEVTATIASAPIVEEPIIEDLLPEELEFEDEDEAAEIEALKAREAQDFVIKPASEAPDFVMPDVTTNTKKK
jgi:S-adenosylmethionine hydrolase